MFGYLALPLTSCAAVVCSIGFLKHSSPKTRIQTRIKLFNFLKFSKACRYNVTDNFEGCFWFEAFLYSLTVHPSTGLSYASYASFKQSVLKTACQHYFSYVKFEHCTLIDLSVNMTLGSKYILLLEPLE